MPAVSELGYVPKWNNITDYLHQIYGKEYEQAPSQWDLDLFAKTQAGAKKYGGYTGDPAYERFIDSHAVNGVLSDADYAQLVGMADERGSNPWLAPGIMAAMIGGAGLASGAGFGGTAAGSSFPAEYGAAAGGAGGAFSGGVGAETLAGGLGTDTLGGAIDWAAIDAGQAAFPWSEGLANLSPEALGGGAAGPSFPMPYQSPPLFNPPNGPLPSDWTPGMFDSRLAGTGLSLGSSATSALSKLLSGNASAGDYASLLGTLGATGLGILGANKQADAYKDVANQYLQMGAPYRNQLAASYQPGFDLAAQPGYGDAFAKMADTSARSYSARMGNPADNPAAQAGILSDVWNQGYLPAMSNYRGQLGQFGGMGLNTSSAASLQGAGNAGDAYNAVGFGLGQLTNPQPNLQELLKQLGGNGLMGSNYKLTY